MSSESQTTRQLREHFIDAPRRKAPDQECPPPERLWAGVHGELTPDEVGAVIDHTAACSECAEAWRLAREISLQAGEDPLGAANPSRSRKAFAFFTSSPVALAIAAALLLLVVTPLLFFNRPADVVRGPEAEIASLVPEDAVLPRDNCLLAWSAGPEGSTYRLTVADQDLEPLLERRNLGEARFVVPQSALSGVPSPGRIFWQVERTSPGGVLVESPTFIAQVE